MEEKPREAIRLELSATDAAKKTGRGLKMATSRLRTSASALNRKMSKIL